MDRMEEVMEKALSEVGMAGITGSVVLGWAPVILAVPAAAYYLIKIYNEFIKKEK